jgi:cytoskeletal protein CcmA (bactofilin family)
MEVQEQTEETQSEVPNETQPYKGKRHAGGDSHNGGGNSGGGIVLGPRDSLVGKLTTEGDVRVQGTLEGELAAGGDVWIDDKATVKASVEGRNVQVRGELEGDLVAKDRLLLAGSGSVQGNVRVRRLAIEDGATLNGNVAMSKGEG